jgi:hypothetical protein
MRQSNPTAAPSRTSPRTPSPGHGTAATAPTSPGGPMRMRPTTRQPRWSGSGEPIGCGFSSVPSCGRSSTGSATSTTRRSGTATSKPCAAVHADGQGVAGAGQGGEEAGAGKLDPKVIEFGMDDGTAVAIVPDNASAGLVQADGRKMAVYTADEIKRLLAGFPALAKAKHAFPGARSRGSAERGRPARQDRHVRDPVGCRARPRRDPVLRRVHHDQEHRCAKPSAGQGARLRGSLSEIQHEFARLELTPPGVLRLSTAMHIAATALAWLAIVLIVIPVSCNVCDRIYR